MLVNAGSYHSKARKKTVNDIYSCDLSDTGRAYVQHVLAPESTEPVGIPSLFNPLSTVLRLNTTTTVTTTLTNGLIVLNPWQSIESGVGNLVQYLPLTAGASDLNAGTPVELWTARSVNTMFGAYRPVAACLKVQYVGVNDNGSGFFAGGLIHTIHSGAADSVIDTLQEVIDNAGVVQTHWSEGIRCIWTPADYSDQDFLNIGGEPSHTGKLYVAYQGFPTTGVLKIEAYVTYELLPNGDYRWVFPGKQYPEDTRAKETLSDITKDLTPTAYDGSNRTGGPAVHPVLDPSGKSMSRADPFSKSRSGLVDYGTQFQYGPTGGAGFYGPGVSGF